MTYDAAHSVLVLFGGDTGGTSPTYDFDTWTWNGTSWTLWKTGATGPSPREGARMTYDAATGTVVLYGGYGCPTFACTSQTTLADTWTWNGSAWTAICGTATTAACGPSVRRGASLAYDAAHSTVVLFGGWAGGAVDLNDTWTFDGVRWTQQTPATSPAVRFGASLAYDPASSRLALFGGRSTVKASNFADTWTWDGSTWTQQTPAVSPPAGVSVPMADGTAALPPFDPGTPPMLYAASGFWAWRATGP
jgi:hypothetical protein